MASQKIHTNAKVSPGYSVDLSGTPGCKVRLEVNQTRLNEKMFAPSLLIRLILTKIIHLQPSSDSPSFAASCTPFSFAKLLRQSQPSSLAAQLLPPSEQQTNGSSQKWDSMTSWKKTVRV